MAKDSLYRPLDHFLQTEIITKLTASSIPIRFSDLKDASIENSLFMYHANKLIDRGLIQKVDNGFTLTTKGARWANYVDTSLDLTPLTPRPLVQFIIEDTTQNILMATRKGSLKERLNDHLLPGNVYRHGLSLDENVSAILTELFGADNDLVATLVTIADVIHTASDQFVSHVICYLFRTRVYSEKTKPLEHPLFTAEWVSAKSITYENPVYEQSEFLQLLFQRLPHIRDHETFRIIV